MTDPSALTEQILWAVFFALVFLFFALVFLGACWAVKEWRDEAFDLDRSNRRDRRSGGWRLVSHQQLNLEERPQMSARSIVALALAGIVTIIGLTVVLGSWYTIDQGQRGVLLRNGAIVGTAEPGLGFKTPWIESVVEISVQTHKRGYGGESVFEAYSRDQQPANMRLSVLYHVPADQVREVYEQFGGEDGVVTRLLDPHVYEKTKTVFGGFNAATAIQERGRLNAEVTKAIANSVKGPLIVESVQIEDIAFSEAYENSVEARMLAEVEVQKLQQNAQREKVQAEIAVTQAKARADAVRAEALAAAEATRLRGEAEASAIDARGKALQANPSVINLVQAERWDGKLPVTMLPGSSVPFIGVK